MPSKKLTNEELDLLVSVQRQEIESKIRLAEYVMFAEQHKHELIQRIDKALEAKQNLYSELAESRGLDPSSWLPDLEKGSLVRADSGDVVNTLVNIPVMDFDEEG